MKRRDFLRRGAVVAAAAGAVAGSGRPAFALGHTEVGGMKLGLVTYNLAKSWDLDTIIERCEKTGFEGVELRTTHRHAVEPSLNAEERAAVKAKFEESKVRLWGLGTACEYHAVEPEKVRQNVELTKRFIDLAKDIGAVGIKVRPNGLQEGAGIPVPKTLEQIGKALNECGQYGQEKQVEIWVEVHGGGTSHPPHMRTIMEQCDHPWVFVCWNSNASDIVDGSVKQCFDLLKPWMRELHMGDLWNPGYPYRELFRLLHEMEFDGFQLAELHYESDDPERVMQYYRGMFDALKELAAEG